MEIAQSGEIDYTKVLSTELKRALQTTKEMDVLGYLHIVTNLTDGSYALSSDELKLLKTKIKDLFNSYVVQFDDEFVESMNDGLKNLLDSFKLSMLLELIITFQYTSHQIKKV